MARIVIALLISTFAVACGNRTIVNGASNTVCTDETRCNEIQHGDVSANSPDGAPLSFHLSFECNPWITTDRRLKMRAGKEYLTAEQVHQEGGIDFEKTGFMVHLHGNIRPAVEIYDLQVVDVKKKSKGVRILPWSVTEPSCRNSDNTGVTALTPRVYKVNLFECLPSSPSEGPCWLTPGDGISGDYEISQNQTETFDISTTQPAESTAVASAGSDGSLFSWKLRMEWMYEGKSGTFTIDDSGKPFQTDFPPSDDVPAPTNNATPSATMKAVPSLPGPVPSPKRPFSAATW